MNISEINFIDIKEDKEKIGLVEKVLNKCFTEEKLNDKNLYINVILTTPKYIRKVNNEYRSIDEETDVLSFPMFEKEELAKIDSGYSDVLGDIVISIERVEKQADEYNHSFERELAYMVVHGFYHLIGYDHIKEEDKTLMRAKEENILEKLSILR